jgi:putative sterol carrier protein
VAPAEPVETPATIFATIDARLRADPARAAGRSAAYAFDLSGESGGMFHIVLADGAGRAGEGAPDGPDVTLSMTAADFVAMTLGQLDGTMAFIEGRIGIVGDIGLAVDLGAVFAGDPPPPGNPE